MKLLTDINIISSCQSEDQNMQPLLIIGNGRTYNIADTSPKRAIMNIIQKSTSKKSTCDSISDELEEEQIYWLKPVIVSPPTSPDRSKLLCWRKKPKKKVIIHEATTSKTG